jgi:hypothetical protein
MWLRLAVMALILSSCGSNYHLKKAKYHIERAKEKGAVIKSDTVYKQVKFKVDALRVQFTPKPLVFKEPIFFTKDSVITKVLIKNNTVYTTTECPERIIEKEVPVYIKQEIKPKEPKYNWWQLILFGLIVGFFGGVIVMWTKR